MLLNEAGHEQMQKYRMMGYDEADIRNLIGEDTNQTLEWPEDNRSPRRYRYNIAFRHNNDTEDIDILDIIEDSEPE